MRKPTPSLPMAPFWVFICPGFKYLPILFTLWINSVTTDPLEWGYVIVLFCFAVGTYWDYCQYVQWWSARVEADAKGQEYIYEDVP